MQNKNNWFSFAIYHNNINDILSSTAYATIENLQQNGSVSQFIFNRNSERGENLLLLLKYTNQEDEDKIREIISSSIKLYFSQKPAPEKQIALPVNDWFLPFPNNYIDYKNNFLFDVMETGGIQASAIAENIFSISSKIIGEQICICDDTWSIEYSFSSALQLNFILTKSFNVNIKDLKNFYQYFFDFILKSSSLNNDEASKIALLTEFEENFENQKDGIVDFINYLNESINDNDSFDEDWVNTWLQSSKKSYIDLTDLQRSAKYVTPEGFHEDKNLDTDSLIQDKWPVLAYYLRFINCQIDLSGVYELNLIYTLKRSVEAISIAQEINSK